MSEVVTTTIEDGLAVLTIDNPPVNAVSQPVRQQLLQAVRAAAADDQVEAVLLHCAGRTFVAGADISEFDGEMAPPHLTEVIDALEGLDKLTVAALHGTALGGGLEIALGVDYRCASPDARVGFPEVTLGIIPGANGTQRLPRLIGATAALDMIGSGAPVDAATARGQGLIDEVVESQDLLAGATAYVRDLLARKAPKRRVSQMEVPADSYEPDTFRRFRDTFAGRMRNQQAPQRAVDAVQAAVEKSFPEGARIEDEITNACMASTESAALRHQFFASREVGKVPGLEDVQPRAIGRVAMIGAGTMGGGIAMNFLNIGVPVTLVDASAEALASGIERIRGNYEVTVKRGRLTAQELEARMALIQPATDIAAVADADLVIEAVYEDMALKKDVFGQLDRHAKPGAILASNTSTLDLNEIAAATSRPGDIIGLHFFSPANVMRLLEIVRGAATSDQTLATALALAKRIRKTGVVAGVCYGFIGNRMMESYGREGNLLLLEGASPKQVDDALYGWGMAMGMFAMYDMAGTDIGYKTHLAAPELFPDDERYYLISHKLAQTGRLGQKTGEGMYRYENGSRTPLPDDAVHAMIEAESKRLGISRRSIDDREIVERCIYPMINEAARILEEGIALRPGDIDVVWTNGYGFPAYRGGPLFYADTVGAAEVFETICRYGEQLGNEHGYWTPAPLLETLAKSGGTFADWKPASAG